MNFYEVNLRLRGVADGLLTTAYRIPNALVVPRLDSPPSPLQTPQPRKGGVPEGPVRSITPKWKPE